MTYVIESKTKIQLGVVSTHLKFVGGLLPDENGRIPRNEDGKLLVVANMGILQTLSAVKIDCVQVSYFPGLDESDVAEMVSGFRALHLDVHFILMIGGADPMNSADEDAVVEMLVGGLTAAKNHGIAHVSSTSVEEWMKAGGIRREGADFDAAVAQNVKVHLRAAREAEIEDSSIKAWHIEFLRGGEFQTFTDLGRIWQFIRAVNKAMGETFFKVIVDAAHCGDSSLTIDQNVELIEKIGAAGELGMFHASTKTTRGCLSADDGWVGALLSACAKTGTLETVFVEMFHHEDEALAQLRDFDPGHGIDTCDGRTYDQVVTDGLATVARRWNNLAARGLL